MISSIARIKFKTLKSQNDSFDVLDDIIQISTNNLILVNGYGIETSAPLFWAWFKVANQKKLILGISNSFDSHENEYALKKIGDCIIKYGSNIHNTEKEILNIYN